MRAQANILRSGIISIFTALLFAVFNLVTGIIKGYVFGTSIAGYYFIVFFVRLYLFIIERKQSPSQKHLVAISALMLTFDILLAVPIALMVFQMRTYNLGMIIAIAIASYATYKISSAIYNHAKTRKSDDKLARIRTSINLIDALVSILLLQNTLIVANAEQYTQAMHVLTMITSGVIYLAIVALSILNLIHTLKKTPPRQS